MSFGNSNGRPDVIPPGIEAGKHLADNGAERVQRDNPLWISPTGMRANGLGWGGIGQVRAMGGLQRPAGYGQGAVERIRARVRANRIAVSHLRQGGNHRAALLRLAMTPLNRNRLWSKLPRMGGQDDMRMAYGRVPHCWQLHR
jgi:hypothetical protein